MLQKLEKHINENLSFLKGNKLLIACSGGLDSVVLTHLLKQLQFTIALVHCNFSLRGKESDADEDFVIALAETLSVPVYTETFDTQRFAKEHALSTQMAARELRYRWFEEIAVTFQYPYIITAHHADDALETFFINISRGTGLRGLTGIPQQNEKIIRPLLPFSRADILQFAKKNELFWREDSSNKKTDYLRNAIRLNVIPPYKEAATHVLQSFGKTQQHLRASQFLLEDYMALIYKLAVTEETDGYIINIKKLQELPHTDALLYELLYTFGFTAWEDVSALLTAQSGKQLFSKTHRLLKDRETLLLTQLQEENVTETYEISEKTIHIADPVQLYFSIVPQLQPAIKNEIYVDRDLLTFPLQLRKWKKGDVFQPFGMKGKKKLSKFFKDEKVSLVAKEKVWILCSNERIVWVVGMRQEDHFKVTEATQTILKIAFKS